MNRNNMIVDNPLQALGCYPLLRASKDGIANRAEVLMKVEGWNPGGSMKDRVADYMIRRAEKENKLQPGGTIIESSSGSLAIGLALVGAVRGYKVIIVTDPRMPKIVQSTLKAYGARIEFVQTQAKPGGWQVSRARRLKELLAENPGAYYPCQHHNPQHPETYDGSMAREILDQTGGKFDAFVCAVGSGGSIAGNSRIFKKYLPHLKVVAVDSSQSVLFGRPDGPRLLSGLGSSIYPKNVDYSLIDEVVWADDEPAFAGSWHLAAKEGVFAGGSSGAVYFAALKVAMELGKGKRVVCMLPDSGAKYYDTVYSQDWLQEKEIDVSRPIGEYIERLVKRELSGEAKTQLYAVQAQGVE